MRNFILLFVTALFVGCTSYGVQVTTDDEKSQAIKAVYDGYLANDYTASNELYSDDTAIYINSVESISSEENLASFSSHHDFYNDISMSNGGVDGAYIQTSVYGGDLGTWTHAWFVWKGTGKASGNTYEVPCHVAYQWGDDGKVVQTWFFSDQSNHLKELAAAGVEL